MHTRNFPVCRACPEKGSRATVARWSAAEETKERCLGNLQHGVRNCYRLRHGIAHYSVASVKALGDPYFVFTEEAKHGSMLVGKPRGTWLITLANTVGEGHLAALQMCGLTHSPCGHFVHCRDKICAMPNPLSGKLMQGTVVSFHVSLVTFLSERWAAHFSPVKGLAVIPCRCRTSEPLEPGRKAAAFSPPRPHRCRHGRALGKNACCDAAMAPPAR